MSDPRFFITEEHGDATALILQEPANADTLMFGDLREQLFDLVESAKPTKLMISYREFERVSTEVINILLTLQKRISELGGQMKLCEMSQKVRSSYKLLKLDGTIFSIHNSLADAEAAF